MNLDEFLSEGNTAKKPVTGEVKGEKVATVLHVAPRIDPKLLTRMEAVFKITYQVRSVDGGPKEMLVTLPSELPVSSMLQWVEAKLTQVWKQGYKIDMVQRLAIDTLSLPKEV